MANQEFSSRILKTNIPYVALLGWIPFRFCLIPLDGANLLVLTLQMFSLTFCNSSFVFNGLGDNFVQCCDTL